MNKAAATVSVRKDAVPFVVPIEERPRSALALVFKNLLAPLASLRLTVALIVLSLVLVFFGTLAQVDEGIWTVLHSYFRAGIAWFPCQIFVRFLQVFPLFSVFFEVSPDAKLSGYFPFPGGWTIGALLLVNLLAAHVFRFRLSWKRSGILLIHAGMILMLSGELVTGLCAVEGRMTIPTGMSANFTEDHHATELAILDTSDSKTEDVVVIPDSILDGSRNKGRPYHALRGYLERWGLLPRREQGPIQNELLPFDVEVVQYMVNSDVPVRATDGQDNPASAGDGRNLTAVPKPEVSGVDPNQNVDAASAYVTFKKKDTGASLGTYLVSVWWPRPQMVTVDGKTYDVFLRFQRAYKPYTFQLLEFKHEKYLGTDIPKNYSSRVRLTDAERGEDREVLIYMNNPLWYRGETFYQSGILPDDKGTILQVVHNPGWLLPYISFTLVLGGMLLHFGISLVGFLRKRAVL